MGHIKSKLKGYKKPVSVDITKNEEEQPKKKPFPIAPTGNYKRKSAGKPAPQIIVPIKD